MLKEIRDIKDIKDKLDQGLLVLKVIKDIKVIMEHRVLKVIMVHRAVYPLIQFLQVVSSYGLVHLMRFQVVGYYAMVIIVHLI